MNYDCSTIAQMAPALPLVQSCDIVPSGALRLATPFSYPNGEGVDVFLYVDKKLINEYWLSDFGQAYTYLHSAQIGMLSTSRKREIVDVIASQMHIRNMSGELAIVLRGDSADELSRAIARLAQACVRISDLATHQRLRSANPFRDDVEDFFDAKSFSFAPDVKLSGPYKMPIRIDFEVSSERAQSYVNVLSALNSTSAHASATEIFTKWHDLAKAEVAGHQFVTIYNSNSRAIKRSDIDRLQEYSQVLSYPEEHDKLARVLAGEDVA